ncbi:hypothetical protein [Streptomyces sclerotialus]|uniref:hypothetical protein n=1 Tax=Streptomyces sclerotialus TaxID=1957 RepID=UPI0004CA94E5
MKHRRTRHIETVLDTLDLPEPLTFDALFEAVRDQHVRPLKLHRDPHPMMLSRPCGLWWRGPDGTDHIWVAPETRGAQELHILGHEIGHMLLDHPPMELPPTMAPDIPEPPPEAAQPFKYLPPEYLDAGPALLGRARAQAARQDPEYVRREDEAEAFASLLRRRAAAGTRTGSTDPFLDRLRHSL